MTERQLFFIISCIPTQYTVVKVCVRLVLRTQFTSEYTIEHAPYNVDEKDQSVWKRFPERWGG